MKISVKVPATTANLGPGFDCMGIALPIYNTITIEETVFPDTGLYINILNSENEEIIDYSIPKDENNIVYKAIELLYAYTGQTPSGLKIIIKTNIPISRGLGSSASVIVGGLIAANELLSRPADEAALLSIATEVEGHPDNVAPAILGGFVLSSVEPDGSVVYRKLPWPDDWKITVCIPDYELETQISRSVLPEQVDIKDAAFNAKRCAMLVEAVHTQDIELMKLALQDKLHQQYRSRLVPGLDKIIENLKHIDNVIGCVLSGAGPSILVISHGNNLSEIKGVVSKTWESQNVKVEMRTLEIENQGAAII